MVTFQKKKKEKEIDGYITIVNLDWEREESDYKKILIVYLCLVEID